MGPKNSTLTIGHKMLGVYAALTARHFLRYRPSEILNVCAIYISGFLRALALNLTHCEELFRVVASTV